MSITLMSFTPASGSLLDSAQPIVVDIRSSVAFTRIVIAVKFAGLTFTDQAYAQDPAGGSANVFEEPYPTSVRATVTDPGFFRYTFALQRSPLWPDSPQIMVYGFNSSGEALLASATYLIVNPPEASPFSPPPSLPPLLGSVVDCPTPFYDQDFLLRVVDRSYPDEYIFTIKTKPNGGYEIFQAAAKVEERISIAIARLHCCAFVLTADGGTKATGTVEFYRLVDIGGDVTYKAGTVVRASKSNRDFVTTVDVGFLAGDLGPVAVPIEAIAVGFEYNLPGRVTTTGGEVLPGEIDTIWKAVLDSGTPTADPGMQVQQIVATSGGTSACLDGKGLDLGLPRVPGEADDVYRLRIQTTPDSVSPDAIERGVNLILQGGGAAAVCMREVGTQPEFPGLFFDAGSSDDSPQVPANNYAFDMDFTSRPADRFKLTLDVVEFRGFFLLGVPTGLSATTRLSIFQLADAKRAAGVGFTLYEETIGCP